MLPDREPLGRGTLEHRFGRDQTEEHQDQDEDGVFENRDEPPAEEFLHAQGEQFFLPLALDLTARARGAPAPACAGASRATLVVLCCALGRKLDPARRFRPARRHRRSAAPELRPGRRAGNLIREIGRRAWRGSSSRPSQATSRRAGPGRHRAARADRPRGAGSCPRGKPSSHRLRRAPPGRFARRRRPGRHREAMRRRRSAVWASSVRRRSSSSIHSMRSCAQACVERGLAGREVERLCLRLQPRQVESMRPEGLGCETPRSSRASSRLIRAIEHDRLQTLAAFAERERRSGRDRARPRLQARCSGERARRRASASPDEAFRDRAGRSMRAMPLELVTQALDGECLLERVQTEALLETLRRADRTSVQPISRPAGEQARAARCPGRATSISASATACSSVERSAERSRRVDSTASPGTDDVELPAQEQARLPMASSRSGKLSARQSWELHTAAAPARTTRPPAPSRHPTLSLRSCPPGRRLISAHWFEFYSFAALFHEGATLAAKPACRRCTWLNLLPQSDRRE